MRRWSIAILVFLVAVFAFEVYRAATQSLTIDEAHLYLNYVRPDPPVFLQRYEAGHHILQTYLSWFFARRFGWSEFVLRLPSLLACVAYLAFCFRFSKRIFPASGWFCFGSVLLLTANPLILDFLVIARGYGLALALFAWALLLGIESLERRTLTASGVLAGLGVAANLTFLSPVVALLCVVTLLQIRRNGRRVYDLVREFIGPALVCCALLVMLPLTEMRRELFYVGEGHLADAIYGTMALLFARTRWIAVGLQVGYITPALAIGVICIAAIRRRVSDEYLVAGGTLVLTIAAAFASHWRGGFPYPTARTAIAIIFLIEVVTLTAVSVLGESRRYLLIPLLLGSAFLLAQNDPRKFGEWWFDSRTKEVMRIIQQRQAGHTETFRISAHTDYARTLNYYRLRFRMSNLEEVRDDGPGPGADYYLLHDNAAGAVREMNLKVIYEDKLCHCLVAVRGGG